jgi:CDGSH iron-sulfur domain-containing protein 3
MALETRGLKTDPARCEAVKNTLPSGCDRVALSEDLLDGYVTPAQAHLVCGVEPA